MLLRTIAIFAMLLFVTSASIASAENLKQPTLGGWSLESKSDTGEITAEIKITSDATILAENDEHAQKFRAYIHTLNTADVEELLRREVTLYTIHFENVGKAPLKALPVVESPFNNATLSALYQSLQEFSITLDPGEHLQVRFLSSGKPLMTRILLYTAPYKIDSPTKYNLKTEAVLEWRFGSGGGMMLWLPNFFSEQLLLDSKRTRP